MISILRPQPVPLFLQGNQAAPAPAVTSDNESAVARTNSTLSAESTQRLEINSDASLDIEFDVPASITPDVERALQVGTACCPTRHFHWADLADAGLVLVVPFWRLLPARHSRERWVRHRSQEGGVMLTHAQSGYQKLLLTLHSHLMPRRPAGQVLQLPNAVQRTPQQVKGLDVWCRPATSTVVPVTGAPLILSAGVRAWASHWGAEARPPWLGRCSWPLDTIFLHPATCKADKTGSKGRPCHLCHWPAI